MGQLTIVIVTYRVHEHLARCLEAIADLGHEVIVIDNSPREHSSRHLRGQWPCVRFIDRPDNRGYGAAANLGVDLARGRYVLLLNSDVWPLSGAIETLLHHVEAEPQAAAAGPRLVRPDGEPQRSVFSTPPGPLSLALWTLWPHFVGGASATLQRLRASRAKGAARDGLEVAHEREYLQGSALLLRRDALREVGGFDESFFMFSEEADICRRLRQGGWKVHFVPAATFVHVGGATTGLDPDGAYQRLLLSHLRLLAKYHDIQAAERARRLMIMALWVRALSLSKRSRSRSAARWLRDAPASELLSAHA